MRRDHLQPHQISAVVITELKELITLRDKLVKDRRRYKSRMKEQNATRHHSKRHIQNKVQARMIKQLTSEIKEVEEAIKDLVKGTKNLKIVTNRW